MKTTRLFLTVLLISCSINLIAQNTQMKYLPIPNGCVIDFNSDIKQIKQLPSHSYTFIDFPYAGSLLNPLDETMLQSAYEEYSDPLHDDLFTLYRGQAPKFCQSIVHDANGDLLFFIIDNNIYNHKGESFIDLNNNNLASNNTYDINYGYLTSPKSTNCDVNGVNIQPDDLLIDNELLIVPVPGNCNKYHIIFSIYTYKTTGVPIYPKICYRTLEFIDENTVELSDINYIMYETHPSIDNPALCNQNSRVQLAITDYRDNFNNYLVFIRFWSNLYVYQLTDFGISQSEIDNPKYYQLGADNMQYVGFIRSEMELKEINDGSNNYYLVAIPMYYGPYYRLIKFPIDFSSYVMHSSNNSAETIVYDAGMEKTVFINLNDGINPVAGMIPKGLEFSQNGQFLFISFTNQDKLYYIDALALINNYSQPYITKTDMLSLNFLHEISIPLAEDYGYSLIETGNDNSLYLINSEFSVFGGFNNGKGFLSKLENPDNPSLLNWSENIFSITKGVYRDFREQYLFTDIVDGSEFVYYNHYVENNCCFDFSADIPTFASDGSTDIWSPDNNPFNSFNSNITFDGNLIIPKNKRLVINDMTIKFTEGHGIIMQSDPATMGSRLILDNSTLTSSCGVMWNGIEMAGISNESQFPITSSKQPMVEIRNYSVIENALTGVNALSGGIAILHNSTFKNNENGIYYGFFTGNLNQYQYKNASYIKNCSFITDNALNNPAKYPLSFVSFASVSDIPVTGCDFINSTPIDYNPSEIAKRGYGIYSYGSNVVVKPHCNVFLPYGTECPEAQTDRNTFTGLNYGIQANPMLGSSSVLVEDNVFTNNHRGIVINGEANYPTIRKNEFTIGDLGIATGLYINGSQVFTIEDNIFKDGEVGMVVNNSEDNNNVIYNNVFDNISNVFNASAFLALNDNANQTGSDGLKVKCNDYTNNSYNIAVIDGFIKKEQGVFGLNPTDPAGNTFDVATNCQNGDNGFYVQGASPFVYDYYFHSLGDVTDMDDCRSIADVGITPTDQLFVKNAACPSSDNNIVSPVLPQVIMLNDLSWSIGSKETELDSITDGGNTQYLLDQIANVQSNTYFDLCNLLVQCSPYLSETVLTAFVENSYHGKPNAKTEVLISNSPLPKNSLDKMTETWLPPPFFQTVMQAQAGVNPLELKQSELYSLINEREQILNNIILQCLGNDSVSEMKDTLMMVFANETDCKTKYKYIPFLISQNELTLARQQLNELESYANTLEPELRNETLDYIQLQTIILSIKAAVPGELYRIVNQNREFLLVLANSEKSRGTITAQTLLKLAGVANYTEKIVLPTQGTPKSMQWESNPFNDDNNADNQDNLLNVYPNPASTNIIVEFPIIEDYAPYNEINIYNLQGQLVLNQPVEKQEGFASVDISKISTGNYIVCIGDIYKTKYKKQLTIKH